MANPIYVLFCEDALLGVFSSGINLTNHAHRLSGVTQDKCIVKTVEADRLAPSIEAGFDHQGTRLSEWLCTGAANQ